MHQKILEKQFGACISVGNSFVIGLRKGYFCDGSSGTLLMPRETPEELRRQTKVARDSTLQKAQYNTVQKALCSVQHLGIQSQSRGLATDDREPSSIP